MTNSQNIKTASCSLQEDNTVVGRYLSIGIILAGGLSYKQTKRIFLVSLRDYLEGKIHIYDLGDVAEEICFLHNVAFGTGDVELDRLLSDLSDIDIYYEERDKNSKYEEILHKLKEYYDSNKYLLKAKSKG